MQIYPTNGQCLSLDQNNNPIVGGITEAGEIRQLLVDNEGRIKLSGGVSNYTILAYYNTTDTVYNYSYYVEAVIGTLITEPKWRAFRIQTLKDGTFVSKKYSGNDFNNLGDELTILSLTYN